MSIVFNGTTHELRSADLGASRPSAYTIAGWFNMDASPSTADIGQLMSAGNSAASPSDAGDIFLRWNHVSGSASNRVAIHRTGTTYDTTNTAGSTSANTWLHRVALYNGSDAGFYENGSLVGALRSVTVTAGAPADWYVAVMANPSLAQRSAGKAAFLAYWDVALSTAEIASLGKGFSPRQIRPQSLRYFVPGLRNANAVVGSTATAANLTFSDDNPRIYT